MLRVHRKMARFLLLCSSIVISLALFGFIFTNVWINKSTGVTLLLEHERIVENFYARRKAWNTSNLGEILFKRKPFPKLKEDQTNKKFTILIYKRWEFLQKRHVYHFGSIRNDPLKECSVRNCEFVGDDSYLNTADAVIVHLHTGNIPKTAKRNRQQRWIFLNDEAPANAFLLSKTKVKLPDIYNIFNWSMTYRTDSDVPVPYGRTIALKWPRLTNVNQYVTSIIPNWDVKTNNALVTILISNCKTSRMKIINRIKKYLPVHVYGGCGDKEFKKSCPGHFKSDCVPMTKYLFYLVLENSKCKEYFTEKIFYHAYMRGAIPIIQGPSLKDCKIILPPNSYIHLDDYKNIKELAEAVLEISKDEERLLSYHNWRNNFEVLNEHGFFGSKSYHLCRVCEAMNYNNKRESIYREDDINRFLNDSSLCRK